MSEIPDELWRKIMEMGVKTNNANPNPLRLSFKDVCSISISCKRLHRLSNEPSVWSSLLSSDFPLRPATNPSKTLYQSWYEKEKAKRVAAHKRAVLRVESRIDEYTRRLEQMRLRKQEEITKFNSIASELSNLHRVRQASVALNVWQPEIIRGRQQQIVEQCAVSVDSHINALEMELRLCKQHVLVFENIYRDEKQRLEKAKEQLSSLKYHPLQDFPPVEKRVDVGDDPSRKRKKLKLHSTASEC